MNKVFSINVSPTIFTLRLYPSEHLGTFGDIFMPGKLCCGVECHWIEAMAAGKHHPLHRTPPSNGE